MRGIFISGIIVVCLFLGYYIVTSIEDDHTTSDSEEVNLQSESESNLKNEGSQEADKSNKEQREILKDLIEESDEFPEDYKTEGYKCKTIEEPVDRGDCFQAVNNTFLKWYTDTSKRTFHFPLQREQDHWEDIFYYEIDENDDASGTLHKTDYYDQYKNPYNPNSDYERRMETIDEYWHIFSKMIPATYRKDLKYVYWTDTGTDVVYTVGRHKENVKDITLLFSHTTRSYQPINKHTLIHEFGHMLTLNESQVKVDEEIFFSEDDAFLDEKVMECSTYFTWCCLEENSYLNTYYEQFWDDIFSGYESIDWDSKSDYKDFSMIMRNDS